MTSLKPCLGVPRVALHWNSTLPPVLTVWEVLDILDIHMMRCRYCVGKNTMTTTWAGEGKISSCGASLGSTSSTAWARAAPAALSAVQRYIPRSRTCSR